METINYATKRYPQLNDSWIVKELNETFTTDRISNPETVFKLLKSVFSKLDSEKEHFISISINTKNGIKSIDLISIGSMNANIVHPREVFYAAIANRAASIITAHNHPSGDVSPSQNDINVIKKLTETGKIIGIPQMDHIIYGGDKWLSFKEQGLME